MLAAAAGYGRPGLNIDLREDCTVVDGNLLPIVPKRSGGWMEFGGDTEVVLIHGRALMQRSRRAGGLQRFDAKPRSSNR